MLLPSEDWQLISGKMDRVARRTDKALDSSVLGDLSFEEDPLEAHPEDEDDIEPNLSQEGEKEEEAGIVAVDSNVSSAYDEQTRFETAVDGQHDEGDEGAPDMDVDVEDDEEVLNFYA